LGQARVLGQSICNLCCNDLAELRLELRLAAARLRHKRAVIRGCITQCGYAV
jgi:hypothetical protein